MERRNQPQKIERPKSDMGLRVPLAFMTLWGLTVGSVFVGREVQLALRGDFGKDVDYHRALAENGSANFLQTDAGTLAAGLPHLIVGAGAGAWFVSTFRKLNKSEH